MNFCQSCSMPLRKDEELGTNADGSKSDEYCCYCFKDGKFIEPDITLEAMIEKCVKILQKMNMPNMIIEMAKRSIPNLKRWKK
jgi:hypothetical protein